MVAVEVHGVSLYTYAHTNIDTYKSKGERSDRGLVKRGSFACVYVCIYAAGSHISCIQLALV